MRIGHGVDVHRLGEGDHVTLAGVSIPHDQSLIAHSDGDVILHALCDALLGAVALGDIGKHFPDTDPKYKNADSRELLRHVYTLIKGQGYQLMNVDITLIAQAPRVAEHIPAMRKIIAEDLDADISAVNVKATTTEQLGFEGRKKGITAHAVVLLVEISAC